MKTNLIKTELTHAQILNHQLNWGYQPNAKDLDNLCPIIHLSKLEIDPEDNQPLDQYQLGMLEYITPHIAYLNTLPSTDYRMSLWPIPLWQRIPISSMVLPSISSRINYR